MNINIKAVGAYLKKSLVLAVSGVVFFLLLLVLYFRLGEPDRVGQSLSERSSLLRKLKANVANSAHLDTHLKDLIGINQRIAANALRVGDLAQNLKLFYELESQTGVKLVDVRPGVVAQPSKTSAPGAYAIIPYSVTLEGEFKQLVLFLKCLESGLQFCRIERVSIPNTLDIKKRLTLELDILGVRS